MKKACVALSLLLMAQSAFASGYNPFMGNIKGRPAQKVSAAKATPSTAALPLPLPSIPAGSVNFSPPAEGRNSPANGSETAHENKANFSIIGRIGDQIVLMDRSGAKSIVQDGSSRSGCFIRFPDIICDKAEMVQAKKEFAADARARVEQDETATSQKAKLKELSTALKEAQEKHRLYLKEAAENKASVSGAKVEIVNLKSELANEKALSDQLKKQLAEQKLSNTKLTGTNSALVKSLAEAAREGEKVGILQKELDAALEYGAKATKELSALKTAIVAPPSWVKGAAKGYHDPLLGEVRVSRAEGQVFFCVTHKGEGLADNLFGRSVVRKERKGDFTYYALNSHNVRIKEQQ